MFPCFMWWGPLSDCFDVACCPAFPLQVAFANIFILQCQQLNLHLGLSPATDHNLFAFSFYPHLFCIIVFPCCIRTTISTLYLFVLPFPFVFVFVSVLAIAYLFPCLPVGVHLSVDRPSYGRLLLRTLFCFIFFCCNDFHNFLHSPSRGSDH